MVRVRLGARSLQEAGHEVSIFALREQDQSAREIVGGIAVHRFPYDPASMSSALKWKVRLSYFIERFTFHSPYWRGRIRTFVEERSIEALHLHHLHLACDALAVGREKGIPVILELHENRPFQMAYYARERGDGLFSRRIIHGQWRWTRYEGRAVKQADHTIVVVDEARERLLRRHGIDPTRVSVVTNAIDAVEFASHPIDPDIVDRYRDDFTILYTGSYQKFRGLDTIIEAMALCAREIRNIRLLIVGWPNPEPLRDELGAQARRLGIGERVSFVDGESPERIPSYIAASRIGVIPHHSNEQTEATIPYKLFEFMACGRAVLVSSCRPLKRVVEETRAGLVFRSGDSGDAARCIRAFCANATVRKLGENGRRAVDAKYNWLRGAQRLLDIYETMVKEPG